MILSDFRVCKMHIKMDVRWFLLKLFLFQMLVAWCGAKHVTIEMMSPKMGLEEVQAAVQNSIRDHIHTGIYSDKHLDTSRVEVTHPVKVTRDGELVSHVVEHSHAHGHARARRDLHGREHHLPHELHYNLTVDGRELRLDLRPSVTFITPALVIERHSAGGRSRARPQPTSTSCHYTGSVRGQLASAVALSACDGLAGHLRTEHGEYWIEPSNQLPKDNSDTRPHIIFRRSAVDKVESFHRQKRSLNSRSANSKQNDSYSNKDLNSRRYSDKQRNRADVDRKRREYLDRRRQRLEAMRRNPVEYRKQGANHTSLRIEERRHSSSKSHSIETSKSVDQSVDLKRRDRNRNNSDNRMTRIRNRRRKHRNQKKRNCATKQPPYQWRAQNKEAEQNNSRYINQNDHQAHRNRYNNRAQYYSGARRPTRSVSKPRHVEVLLVADKSMTDFHDQGNLETYLLTIMNMVSSLYMDPSIGNYIKVVVVKIILVEEINAAPDLEVSTNADSTLASFCRWQQHLNPEDDANPHHHDVAILVTRKDICSQHNSPCSTLGVAHVAGMCKPDRSCSVNEDNGIMLAHTITHELGHNFGLYHDTEKIGCHRRDGATLHIMTPIFEADTVQVAWSRCSKRDVTNFLDAGLGECLSDRPSQEEFYVYPEVPAGVMYDAASQCHLQFGAKAVVCAKPSELCEHLWCLVDDKCKTMLRPAAPGTTCGADMWCQNQTCVARSPSPSPVDGGWSEWSEWSECSRTCGAGVSTQARECNSPAPKDNGAYCIGDRSRYKVCNTEPCPINEPTFREVQCSKHNNMSYVNETITEWIPYFDQDKPCELQCVAKDNDLEMLGGFVADGTPCKQTLGARDMCIAGVCYRVGCDWKVDSVLEEDACGVCGGNGSACKTVLGSYSKDTTKQSGLDEVAVIPAGSRNVKIQEKVSPGNYISIGSAKSRKMYLTGARKNATITEYFVAGTQAIYERDRDWEKVRIPGPLSEDIKVYQKLYHGSRHRNPGVTYQYTVDAARAHSYRLSEWSPCSASCGLGRMRRHYDCLDSQHRVMEQSQCYNIEPPRHEALMQQCLMPPCPTAPPQPAPIHPTNNPGPHSVPNHPDPSRTAPNQSYHPDQTHTAPNQQLYHPDPYHPASNEPYRPESSHPNQTPHQPEPPRPTLNQPPHRPEPPHTARYQAEAFHSHQPSHLTYRAEPPRPESRQQAPNHPDSHVLHQSESRQASNNPEARQHPQNPPDTRPRVPYQPESRQYHPTAYRAAARPHRGQSRASTMNSRFMGQRAMRQRLMAQRPAMTHMNWWAGPWNKCTKKCHMPGEYVMKHRGVYCVDKQSNKVVQNSKCDPQIKPIGAIKCVDVPAC